MSICVNIKFRQPLPAIRTNNLSRNLGLIKKQIGQNFANLQIVVQIK